MKADWIAVDWGTSNLRAWAMGASGVLDHGESHEGMGTLSRDGFEPALLRVVSPWLQDGRVMPVIACGMVGARQGWIEAVYRAVPCSPVSAAQMTVAPTSDSRIRVHIAPGLSQDRPADVMRGEETQIAGALALNPGFDCVLWQTAYCQPSSPGGAQHVRQRTPNFHPAPEGRNNSRL